MKLKADWSNWKVFFVSVIPSLLLTPILEPYYKSIFKISGGWLFPSEVSTYPGTAALLYLFFTPVIYIGFSKSYKGINLFYFLILPIFLVSGPTTSVLTAELIMITAGFLLGKLIRKNLN